MTLAIIYSNKTQECDRAVALMESLDHKYIEYLIGRDFTEKQFRAEFGDKAEFPQVAIDTLHVGGLKETLQYFKIRNLL